MKFAFALAIEAKEVFVCGSWDGFLAHHFSQASGQWECEVDADVVPNSICECKLMFIEYPIATDFLF